MKRVVSAKLPDELDVLFEEKRAKTSLSRSDFLRVIVSNQLENINDPSISQNQECRPKDYSCEAWKKDIGKVNQSLVKLERELNGLITKEVSRNKSYIICFTGGILFIGIGFYFMARP